MICITHPIYYPENLETIMPYCGTEQEQANAEKFLEDYTNGYYNGPYDRPSNYRTQQCFWAMSLLKSQQNRVNIQPIYQEQVGIQLDLRPSPLDYLHF